MSLCQQLSALPRTPLLFDNQIKQPNLTIPPFEGNITQWTPFWNSSKFAIHQNANLTEIDKLNYFMSLLKGSMHQKISGLLLTVAKCSEILANLKS